MMNWIILGVLGIIGLILLFSAIVINREYERALLFRLGSYKKILPQGLHFKIPIIDTIEKVDYRTKSVDVTPQKVLTKDNVSVSVDAIVFYKVKRKKEELKKAVLEVSDYHDVTLDHGQTMLRDMIGKRELDEILQKREELATELSEKLDAKTDSFGIEVEDVEIKDVSVPEEMERAMAAQAEAERNRRARIKEAQGELEAAVKLRISSEILGPKGYKLRTLQTVDSVAQENATIVTIPSSLVPATEESEENIFGEYIDKIKENMDVDGIIEGMGNIENVVSEATKQGQG